MRGSLYTTCIRILQDHLCKTSISRSLCQDPYSALVSRSCRTTCVKFLFQDPFRRLLSRCCKTTCQGLCIRIFWSARIRAQDCVGPLLADLCIRIQICIRVLSDHLRQGPVGTLVQDLCRRILYRDPGSLSASCGAVRLFWPVGPSHKCQLVLFTISEPLYSGHREFLYMYIQGCYLHG